MMISSALILVVKKIRKMNENNFLII